MVDDDFEEGEIEGLVNDALEAKVELPQEVVSQALGSKKQLKKQKKKEQGNGSGKAYFDVYGQQARAGIQIDYGHPIRIPDVQNLIMWTLADGASPQWAFLKNKPLISKLVMVAVPGLSSSLFQAKLELLSSFTALPAPVKLLAKSAMLRPFQTVGQLFSVPHSKKRKKYLESLEAGMDLGDGSKTQRDAALSKKRKRQPFPPKHYVATVETLKTSDYVIPERSAAGDIVCPEGYAATRPGGPNTDGEQPKLFGVDCEMCITAEGFELTRVSLVNERLEVLLDELVLPHNKITDYNTQFSGITPLMLAPVTTRLEDVRSRIQDLIPAEALLVGHALHNDLNALKLIHMNVIDTAFLYPHPKGPPYRSSLRRLTEKFLKRQIQNGSHDSIDDARAAMELALLKFKHGPAFGTTASQEEDGSDPLCEVLAVNGRRCSLVDRNDVLCRHVTGSANAFPCMSDEECTVAAAKEAANAATHFLWTQLRALGSHLEARAWHKRDLTKAELAAKVPITGIHSAPSKAKPAAPAGKKAVLGGQKAAAPTRKPAKQPSKAAQQDSQAASSPSGKKRKRQEQLASHPLEHLSEGDPSQGSSMAAKRTALRSHPIDVDESMLSSSGLQSGDSVHVDQHTAEAVSNGPSSAAQQNGQQGMQSPESLDQLAARARLHRDHVLSTPSPGEAACEEDAPTSNGVVPAVDLAHNSSADNRAGREDPGGQGGAADEAALPALALDRDDMDKEVSQAPAEDKAGADAAKQEALTPEQELARQREVAKQDAAHLDAILQALNEQLGRIWQAVPTNGLLIVMAGHGDTAEVRRLQEQKWRRQQGLDGLPPWTTAAEESLAQAMHDALQGLCFCAVKQ